MKEYITCITTIGRVVDTGSIVRVKWAHIITIGNAIMVTIFWSVWVRTRKWDASTAKDPRGRYPHSWQYHRHLCQYQHFRNHTAQQKILKDRAGTNLCNQKHRLRLSRYRLHCTHIDLNIAL